MTTIHATEKGRVHTIRDALQQRIHEEEQLLCQAADHVITVSHAMHDEVSDAFNLEADRVSAIYNGIDLAPLWTTAVDHRSAQLAERLRAPLICFVGRLVYEKGVDVLLEAAASVARRGIRFELAILGDGNLRGDLERHAAAAGIADRTYFTGMAKEQERSAYLRAATLSVVPSLYEPFGIVALEAMAARCPVIVSETGGLAEVVSHERTGLKVPPGNVAALADALTRLLTDAGLRQRLSDAAYADVRANWGWNRVAEQTLAVYANVNTCLS